jgi:hypothetical protein
MRCSHRLLADERYSPRSTYASRAAAEFVKVAAITNLRAHEQAIAYSAPKSLVIRAG